MNKGRSLIPLFYGVSIVVACMFLILTSFGSDPFLKSVLAQVATSQQQNINATNLFETGQMILSNNVKRLVILIPNEGHHGPGEEDESRFIAQPFVPQNAVVESGTRVVWYNGDVGHEHSVVVSDNSGNQIFDTGEFTELVSSRPITFNNTGNFKYADTIDYEEGFRMTGNITVVNGGRVAATQGSTFDTVGVLMVPSTMVQSVTEQMKNTEFGIDSMHTFTDLRGGQEDTGDKQVLVVWTASGKNLNEISSELQDISGSLPYE
jgi:plastocyanin